MIDEERSPAARARAERALCKLAAHIADDSVPLIVLGGLLPEILTEGREAGPQHLGTSDVDMLLVVHLEQTDGLARIEDALDAAGFDAEPGQNGWRWRGIVEGFPIKLEFLCDLDTEPEGIVAIPGCRVLRANNLRGTGYVAFDWKVRELTANLPGLGLTTVRVRFAGLEGVPADQVRRRPLPRQAQGPLRPRVRSNPQPRWRSEGGRSALARRQAIRPATCAPLDASGGPRAVLLGQQLGTQRLRIRIGACRSVDSGRRKSRTGRGGRQRVR